MSYVKRLIEEDLLEKWSASGAVFNLTFVNNNS